jgi:hypothetical protein
VRFDRWSKVEAAVRALKRALDRLPDNSPMRGDVRALLLRTHEEVHDDKAAADLLAVLRAEARFATVYRHRRHRFDDLSDEWKDHHKKMDSDTGTEPVLALLDSGATMSVFPVELARLIGVHDSDLRRGKP